MEMALSTCGLGRTYYSPKERDLMFIGEGVANNRNNPREEEFFDWIHVQSHKLYKVIASYS